MWNLFEKGKTINKRGPEEGITLKDEEHNDGARITLEKDGSIAPFSITCLLYTSPSPRDRTRSRMPSSA